MYSNLWVFSCKMQLYKLLWELSCQKPLAFLLLLKPIPENLYQTFFCRYPYKKKVLPPLNLILKNALGPPYKQNENFTYEVWISR